MRRQASKRFRVAQSGLGGDVDDEAGVCASHAQENREWHHDEIVLILAENAADLLHGTDDPELVAADANGLADGVHAEKQPLHERVANQADIGAVFGFGWGEVAAELDGARVNVGHSCRLTGEVNVLHLVVAISCADGSAGAGPDLFAGGAFIGYGPHVVELNLLILQRLDDDVEVGHRERSARDLKDIGAEVAIFCST